MHTGAQHRPRSCEAACPPPSCLTLPLAETCTAELSLALTQRPGMALGTCSQSSEIRLPNSGHLLTKWAVMFISGVASPPSSRLPCFLNTRRSFSPAASCRCRDKGGCLFVCFSWRRTLGKAPAINLMKEVLEITANGNINPCKSSAMVLFQTHRARQYRACAFFTAALLAPQLPPVRC